MRQIGFVKQTINEFATVEVSRTSMCDGCSKIDCGGECTIQDMFKNSKKLQVKANNQVGALIGDKVLLESSSSLMLKYAFIVFLIPVIAFLLGYFVTSYISHDENISLIAALAAFILCFVIIGIYEKIVQKKKPKVDIIKVLSSDEKINSEVDK